jgi:hypothetical protein
MIKVGFPGNPSWLRETKWASPHWRCAEMADPHISGKKLIGFGSPVFSFINP